MVSVIYDTTFKHCFFPLVTAPSPVTNVILISYPDSICISWSLPVDDGGEQIGGYHIYLRNLNNTSGFRKISSLASSTNFQLLDHLSANIAYESVKSLIFIINKFLISQNNYSSI